MSILTSLLKLFFHLFFKLFFAFNDVEIRDKHLQAAINLYRSDGFDSYFLKIRAWDAPYLEVARLVPKKGFVLDLGSGDGLFANFLALQSKSRKVVGVEMSRQRVSRSDHKLPNVSFKKGDATEVNYKKVDCIVMFHLLHHLNSYKHQELAIERAVKMLTKNGRLIIVEIDTTLSFKYILTSLVDHFVIPVLFENRLYSKIFFRKASDWRELLKTNKVKTKILKAEDGKPFTHVIIYGTK